MSQKAQSERLAGLEVVDVNKEQWKDAMRATGSAPAHREPQASPAQQRRDERLIRTASSRCVASDASIKAASRKNITSIIGMISMWPRRDARERLSFITVFLAHRVRGEGR
ncbi:hypothetical protein [Paraburkholderia piptadeniae]|uniref:hypothetical protein n=1 Tax=Paraburkholderia piptadeniae TaxID=1701573 RepID=UPI00156D7B21